MRRYLEERYKVPVLAVNCAEITEGQINGIMQSVLFQFPIREISIDMPSWIDVLDDEHWLKKGLYDCVMTATDSLLRISDLEGLKAQLSSYEYVRSAVIAEINLGTGTARIAVSVPEDLFYKIVKETSGFDIDGEDKLMTLLTELSQIKKEYDKISYALHEVQQKGYGIVTRKKSRIAYKKSR